MAWWDSEPTRAVKVEGGIKARSKRGAIGQSWWSARFIQVLTSIGVGGRLDRGRNYARAGQVLELRTGAGTVLATVQGSRPRPYDVRIGLPTYGKVEWAQIEQAMADSAWYAAKLLAGEMPKDIEEVFTSVGLTLFPGDVRDLTMDCSCPDHVVPCKHLAAVFYLLAESFDDDPFGILALRGRDRETLLENIRARRGAASAQPSGDHEPEPVGGAPALVSCLDSYFVASGELPMLVASSAPPDAVLDQLPPIDVTVRGKPLVDLLRPAYRSLADPSAS
ncbi:SWIM zinc finger family protein [Pseudonocardia spinosispora]|uniref:SWIM zinc finger family protein n=1 Tax=Pseudonocardia spinosispora TaxID=103441 RepID=UPI000401DF81|nr:SWIM zinc finger family protein [Pseudonocardia spinosispora]